MKLYGNAPVVLDTIDLNPVEMMFWMYCPIKFPGGLVEFPENLAHLYAIVDHAMADYREQWGGEARNKQYIYLTAKTLWVTKDAPGNRPGWHSDGFMSPDINYIWSDTNPTLFWQPKTLVAFTQDHGKSLAEMDTVEADTIHHFTYPDKTLLRLDESVIHRVGTYNNPGLRTFVKVSFSTDKYDLEGNSHNYGLDYDWPMRKRGEVRNSPQG
jgi:hypothetical protein